MSRTLLTLVLLLVGCKSGDKPSHGPALTPMVANQLKALTPDCEVRAAKSSKGTKELRLCKGKQAMMTLHLDEERNLKQVEIGIWASMLDEARILLEQTLRGVISDKAIEAMTARLPNNKSDPVVVDGVRVNAFYTQAPNENPRYTVDLAW
ncbi:MAG: hypothetical protein M4D80_34315 [Myxococcota bacterium]|nr:hypothetical protein [Myxococcota bacterium]